MNQQFVRLSFLCVVVGLAGLLLVMLPLMAATPSAVSFAAGDASFRLDAIFGDIDLAPSSLTYALSDEPQSLDINRAVDTPPAAVSLRGSQGVTPAQAGPGTLYVGGATGSDTSNCQDLATPCATIGYALSQAGNGNEIRVAEGTYTETLDVQITVTLKGGYEAAGWTRDISAHPTIVDANGADDSVISIYPYVEVTVEGLTVQGANHTGVDAFGGIAIDRATVVVSGTIVQDNQAEANGGGIYIQVDGESASLAVINSSIIRNNTGDRGGGIATSGWPTVTLEYVEVRDNTAQGNGGGLSIGQVTITNSRIVSNTSGGDGGGIHANVAYIYNSEISRNKAETPSDAQGGGIDVENGRLHIEGSVVSGNQSVGLDGNSSGGGITAGNSNVTMIDTRISGNKATGSAFAPWASGFAITNSLIVNNDGVGIIGDETPVTGTIMNTTIADNGDSGISLIGGDMRITNSILWGNGGVDNQCSGNCTFTYSDIGTGDTSGAGNISADPLFVDAANGDYHLRLGSSCIDAGTPVGAPATDIEGTPRDAAPDMGAYEWTGFRIFLPLTLKNFGE